MTQPIHHLPMAALLARVQKALSFTQKDLADFLACSPRTISRYYDRGGLLLPQHYARLATACHPRDRDLAAYLASRAGQTLESMGLEKPPPPAPPPAPPVPVPSQRHLADSIVCAGAEALQMSPHAMRTALVAAFARAVALGMSAEQALAAMTPEKPAKPPRKDTTP